MRKRRIYTSKMNTKRGAVLSQKFDVCITDTLSALEHYQSCQLLCDISYVDAELKQRHIPRGTRLLVDVVEQLYKVGDDYVVALPEQYRLVKE